MLKTAGAGLTAVLLSGCALFLPESVVPIPALHERNAGSPETLVILMPGRGGAARDFFDRGFVRRLLACDRPLRVAAVDAHLGYYADESVAIRLTEDIIRPARERGVEEVWLAGISLGGLGALIHLNDYPGVARGAVLIAPYLGDSATVEALPADLTAAGAPPPGDAIAGVWYGIAEKLDGANPPALYLAAGTEDRFARAHERFARLLDEDRVFRADGGHGWTTWEPLWARILPELPFCSPD